jgi:hypothetical protein
MTSTQDGHVEKLKARIKETNHKAKRAETETGEAYYRGVAAGLREAVDDLGGEGDE